MFILSSNILALIFLNWHTRPLPSHTLYFAKRPHRTITTLLAFCFPTCRSSFACRHFVQGILFGCTDHMPSAHHPRRSRSLCFIVNHKAICLLSVVILIYSHLLALDNKTLRVCTLFPKSQRSFFSRIRGFVDAHKLVLDSRDWETQMVYAVHIVTIHEVMRSRSDEGGVCLMCFIGSES